MIGKSSGSRPTPPSRLTSPGTGKARRPARRRAQKALPGIIDETFREYAELTGREYRRTHTYKTDDARIVVIAMGQPLRLATFGGNARQKAWPVTS